MSNIKIIDSKEFTHVLRIFNTTVIGTHKVGFALRAVKGIGRRFAHILLKKAQIDPNQRAGELGEEEQNKLTDIVQNPLEYNIPTWLLNRQRDIKDGLTAQLVSNNWDTRLREDLERLRKVKCHRGLRHYWGLRVRGQHSKSTGRTGRTIGYEKKK